MCCGLKLRSLCSEGKVVEDAVVLPRAGVSRGGELANLIHFMVR